MTLTILCAGAAAANRPESQNCALVQQLATHPKSGQAADAKPEGDWEGTLAAGAVKLRIVVHITRNEGAYGATLDSPDQGAIGIPIETVTVTVDSIKMVQKEIANFAQTVSYDRAGVGQSEPGPNPRSAKQIATELHTALQKAGVKAPYVLVGHSMGGPYVRVFADLYPKEDSPNVIKRTLRS